MTQINQDQQYETNETGEKPVETGFQRVQFYNKSLEWHEGTAVAQGGFGVEVGSGVNPPPFGEVQRIKHQGQGGKTVESDTMVAREIEVAIIGVSDAYTSYWPDMDTAKSPILMPRYFKAMDKKMTRGGISLFVVFKCDPDRKVFELPIKTFNVENALNILSQVDRATRAIKAHFNSMGTKISGEFMRYAVWVKLAAGDTIKVGSEVQGNSTKIIIVWPKPIAAMTDQDYWLLRVTPEENKQFKGFRKQLDEMMATGFRKPNNPQDLPQLEEAYRTKAAANPDKEDAGSAPKKLATRVFDVEKVAGRDWSLSGWLSVKGSNGLQELDDLLAIAVGDSGYHIEDALVDVGSESLMDLSPDLKFGDFLKKVIASHAMKLAKGKA